MNQFKSKSSSDANRYDVTVLINGLPLIHIELKMRGVDLMHAFNQIARYKNESMSKDDKKIYDFVEIFVISNGTQTKYYSNTILDNAYNQIISEDEQKQKKEVNTFNFTSFWTDISNKHIEDLIDFTETFFQRKVLLNIICKYSVFNSNRKLLIMRPYQIAATEKILQKVDYAIKNPVDNMFKKKHTGGYIWHTTGSGKTLTSFKVATLLKDQSEIDKVLFAVDRRELDYQTIKEYEAFEKGAAQSNISTRKLIEQLNSGLGENKVIVTTIQKLNKLCQDKNYRENKEIFSKRTVIIFDECHRSQFGKFHKNITSKFKNAILFGFTGTPIFKDNANLVIDKQVNAGLIVNSDIPQTTEDIFRPQLHKYTIIDGIEDGNVLPSRVEYQGKFHSNEFPDKQIVSIDKDSALISPERITKISQFILENFSRLTKRTDDKSSLYDYYIQKAKGSNDEGSLVKVEIKGFNALLATKNIEMAQAYYKTLTNLQKDKGESKKLKIAIIYSYEENQGGRDYQTNFDEIDENYESIDNLNLTDKEFLRSAIDEYNKTFHTNWGIDSNRFQGYYKDVSLKMKNRELDLLIVVNMFLTGFDAKVLNTLFVDKLLSHHGLIQAFSRTNRILNDIKNFGNIVCFQNIKKQQDDALRIFGNDEDSQNIILLRPFNDYINGYTDESNHHHEGWNELIKQVLKIELTDFQSMTAQDEKKFISLFNKILKLRNILSSFEDFKKLTVISPYQFDNYKSYYIDLYQKYKKISDNETEKINKDVSFEIELLQQDDINIDYILNLIVENKDKSKQDIIDIVVKKIDSNINLKSKKSLIMDFINKQNISNEKPEVITMNFDINLREHYRNDIIELCERYKLNLQSTTRFLDTAIKFRNLSDEGLPFHELTRKTIVDKYPSIRANAQNQSNVKKLKLEIFKALEEIYYKYSNDTREYY
ncbi:type I restriction endonuclease subunit R [Mycoplasma phocoeninasale]|uniref:type I restriction endonuclease subunit R n=1 Tax=Mycoplasma phocoeninasale TaxID=2726117 RepID=UPI00301409F5